MINWKPFSTAPKNRPFYAYSEREGVKILKWEEPPLHHIWKAAFKRQPNDLNPKSIISYASIDPDSWEYWCEISEIKPKRNSVTPTDVGKAFRERSRAVTEPSNNYTKDFAEF